MSIQAVDSVIRRQFGNRIQKLILLTLADFADEDGRSWPAVETIAFRSECSVRAAQEHLAALVEAGLLDLRPNAGRGHTNVYRLKFENFPPVPAPPGKGAAPAPPPADHAVKGADDRVKGANPRRESAPYPSGTQEPGEGTATPPPPDPVVGALLRAFPDAPAAFSPPEVDALRAVHLHLTDLDEEDWLAVLCWNRAPDRIRGRKLWPRSRREFLENLFEAVEHIRRWWRKEGHRWHYRRHGPPATSRPAPGPAAEPAAEPADTLTTEEALAILRD